MPQLTAFFGLEGSGRAERAARSGLPLAHTREEALRLLRAGISCALDAPDLKARGRKDLVERARAYGAQARAVLVARPEAACIAAAPDRAEEIRDQVLAFCPPQPFEGWKGIELVYAEPPRLQDLGDLFFGREGLVFLSQDNPFHAHSIGMHCLRTARGLARERPGEAALWLAGLLHDVGKARTKAFRDSHGLPSPTAHFYGHECASAYAILFLRFPACVPEGERLRVSAMAAWHMVPFFFFNEHTRARYLRLWGEDFLRDMEALDRADRAAQR